MQQLDPEPPKIKDFSFHEESVYRWLKTDVSGTDEILVRVNKGFAEFRSGRKCNLEILQEFMDPISAGPDRTAEKKAAFKSLTAGLAVEETIAKHPEQLAGLKNEFSDPEMTTGAQTKITPARAAAAVKEKVAIVKEKSKSPVRLILDSNKSSMTLETKLEISTTIPDEDIFRVLKNSFPDSDILGEVAEKILSEMDTETIVTELKELIKNNLDNRYNVGVRDK